MPRLAIYPGSFDPLTLGHLDVIERASRLVDELVVAVGENSAKRELLTPEQRMEVILKSTSHIPHIRVDSFSGLLVDYAADIGADLIVRGLRATADFEYEFQMATVNRKLKGSFETIFLMTKWEHSYLSSTIVKELARLGGDYSSMVPAAAAESIAAVLQTSN